jgi:hypothetical protein
VHLKLLNPLGVGASLVDATPGFVKDRLALLKDDFETLDDVERQLEVYQQDLTRDFEFRMSDIDRILLEMERRGHEYFDETMRIGRVMDLLNRSRVQQGSSTRSSPTRRNRSSARSASWSTGWSTPTCGSGRASRTIWRIAAGNTRSGSSVKREGALSLRPRPPDRRHGPGDAQGGRFLRSTA